MFSSYCYSRVPRIPDWFILWWRCVWSIHLIQVWIVNRKVHLPCLQRSRASALSSLYCVIFICKFHPDFGKAVYWCFYLPAVTLPPWRWCISIHPVCMLAPPLFRKSDEKSALLGTAKTKVCCNGCWKVFIEFIQHLEQGFRSVSSGWWKKNIFSV